MVQRILYLTPEGLDNLEVACSLEGILGIRFTSAEKGEDPFPNSPFPLAKAWLDAYFEAKPIPPCPFLLEGVSPFQKKVYEEARKIPFGETCSYGELSRRIAFSCGLSFVSPRAVGQALKRNPLLLYIPCHRILGSEGSLRGYAGGRENKKKLIEFERKAVADGKVL